MFATFTVDDQRVYFVLVHSTSPKSASEMAERDAQINGIQKTAMHFVAARHVIVAGDFNATTASRSLQTFMDVAMLKDSRRGFGLQHSWPTWCWPISVCIDHCFVSRGVHVVNRRVGPNLGSDHLPVIVDFSLGRHRKTRQKPESSFNP